MVTFVLWNVLPVAPRSLWRGWDIKIKLKEEKRLDQDQGDGLEGTVGS